MNHALSINRECIVRDRPCGRVFSGSNTCFVASPSAEEVGLELDVIKAVLAEEDIEPYIAVEHFAPAKDIFCSKICTKIIESKLCVVLLTGPTNKKGMVLPNPNVYYEYGLMSAWKKPLIPVQREDQELAFNIQSLDTVKYSSGNFRERFHHALRIVLSTIEEEVEDASARLGLQDLLSYYMELKGYPPLPSDRNTQGTPFIPFRGWKFGLIITGANTVERLTFHTKLLYRRLETYIANIERQVAAIHEQCEREKKNLPAYQALMNRFNKKKSVIDRVKCVEIIIVDASERGLGNEILEELQKIKSILHPTVTLLSSHDLKAEIDLA